MNNKNLLVALLLSILMWTGCKEVFSSKGKQSLTNIAYVPEPYPINIPEGLPRFEPPADNPLTLEGVALGNRLFHDPILSADSTQSCASCHIAEIGFTDGKARSIGIDGIEGRRSAMSLSNVAFYNTGLFWDGRAQKLEDQALIPVEDPVEMRHNWEAVVDDLRNHTEYPVYFRKAFGIKSKQEIDKFLVAKAIAQFERTLISGDTKFDIVMRGEDTFSKDEAVGYDIFFDFTEEHPDAECGHCHNAPLFTTLEFENNGITPAASFADYPDPGLGGVNGKKLDIGKFRIPSLRNIALTAPYMHDGRFETLEEVIEHYNSGGHDGPNVSPVLRPLNLTKIQKRQVIAFLHTLTDRNFTAVKDAKMTRAENGGTTNN
jgi:cytochrome c peroxidase